MKRSVARAIIDATVDRGLREIYEDPRRSIRKLADLGKQYNDGRFTQDVYAIFQDLLRNDDSPYYTAIEHLLQNTDRKALKHFGINLGYNGFTVGGKTIRTHLEKNGLNVPWLLIFRLDPLSKTSLTPRDLINLIAQAKTLGIYSYAVILENSLDYFEDLLKVFNTYDDCSFMFVLPDEEIPGKLHSCIPDCTNVLYFLPAFEDSCGANVRTFKRYKAWYGLYTEYSNETTMESTLSVENAWEYLLQDGAFLLTIAKPGTDLSVIKETTHHIKEMRLAPVVPLFMFDLYGDAVQIQKLVSGQSLFFEICADGSYHTSSGDFPSSGFAVDPKAAFQKVF